MLASGKRSSTTCFVNILQEKAGLLSNMKTISKYLNDWEADFNASLFGKKEDDYQLPELVAWVAEEAVI